MAATALRAVGVPRTFIPGVGMTKFSKPHTLPPGVGHAELGAEAAKEALTNAGIIYTRDVEAVVASYCYGEPTCGQRAIYSLGLSGIPIFNVNNNCSSASSALMLARKLVQSGYDCVLAVGFEQMERFLSERYPEKVSPVDKHVSHMTKSLGADPGLVRPDLNPMTSDVIKMFAYAMREYLEKYPNSSNVSDLVDITYKNRKQGLQNPKASIQKLVTPDEIANKAVLCSPITFSMSAATADGGAAAVVCSERFIRSKLSGDFSKTVEIVSQHMVTDLPSSFGSSFMDLCGYDMSKQAAVKCYQESGLSARDVDVFEVHDCFSCNELFMYEALGLAEEGQGSNLIRNCRWVRNGSGGEVCLLGDNSWVVNPSGGLESKGHPIGATGLAQCYELVMQLLGQAERRQVPGARTALQHNFGIGGAAVCTLYRRGTDDATADTPGLEKSKL